MTPFDRLKKLADEQAISINTLEERIGLGRNTLYSWKKKTPSGTNLEKVADYFDVSVDYLLGRSDQKNIPDNRKEDSITYYRIDTQGLSDDEVDDLRSELDNYTNYLKDQIKKHKQGGD